MIRRMAAAAILLTWCCASALAHTPLKQSVPASGSVLAASPDSVLLEFAQPVRLTQLRVELEDGTQRKLDFAPRKSADRFICTDPELPAGSNLIHWTALSADGHVIQGTIGVVIDPNGAR